MPTASDLHNSKNPLAGNIPQPRIDSHDKVPSFLASGLPRRQVGQFNLQLDLPADEARRIADIRAMCAKAGQPEAVGTRAIMNRESAESFGERMLDLLIEQRNSNTSRPLVRSGAIEAGRVAGRQLSMSTIEQLCKELGLPTHLAAQYADTSMTLDQVRADLLHDRDELRADLEYVIASVIGRRHKL